MAIFIRFNKDVKHDETCLFQLFNKKEPYFCGEKAVGRRGRHGGVPLCKEHFKYTHQLEGQTKRIIEEGAKGDVW